MTVEVPAVRRVCLAATGLGWICLAVSARADVKIVSDVTQTRQPDGGAADPASQNTVTTYYKARRARVDVEGGTETLYNADSERVYVLDPAKRTYYVLPLKQVQEGRAWPDAAETEGENLEAKVDLKSPDGAETRTIAGLVAKEYDVSGSVGVKPRDSGGGGLLGGIFGGGGGGGFPGGGGGHHRRGGGGGGGQRGERPPQTEISGEVWLSDAAALPDDKKATALPTAQQLVFGGGPALKPLTDSLNKKKRLPLYSRITLTRTARRSRGYNGGDEGGQDSTQAAPEQTITTTTQVKSFFEGTVDDSLFQLPSGYVQVDPPLPPQRGGEASRRFVPD